MQDQIKRLLIAGIPLYLALFMIIGRAPQVYARLFRNAEGFAGAVRGLLGIMWSSLFIVEMLFPRPIRPFVESIGILRCNEARAVITSIMTAKN